MHEVSTLSNFSAEVEKAMARPVVLHYVVRVTLPQVKNTVVHIVILLWEPSWAVFSSN